ncbi:MAG: hypothetical protein JWM85_844 [Acidimicrobiaceae bacterium]|jgi:hypothetical protein|nr:hypothetical protein [Acidimicrobiaceae bacterium]
MSSHFDAAYYEDLRGRVRGLLIATSEFFPPDQVGRVDVIIDANESGVALEMLGEMLVEVRAVVDSDIVEQFERLAQDMGLAPDLSERVKGLKPT